MNAVAAGHTYVIEERFDKALKLVRAALTAGDLEIVGEMDMPTNWPGQSRQRPPRCRVLLVDCPLLLFEGLALDRAAGVYFPLHVLMASDGCPDPRFHRQAVGRLRYPVASRGGRTDRPAGSTRRAGARVPC